MQPVEIRLIAQTGVGDIMRRRDDPAGIRVRQRNPHQCAPEREQRAGQCPTEHDDTLR
ncbi:hypothetical protein [Burkholderia metallica]|uniref:hypothetical protein n=1 Tax=Burkholderia metallica TaxID=488729 RepID=UPI0015842AE2|nr:hypothetical protein [Burkholderia metallica]